MVDSFLSLSVVIPAHRYAPELSETAATVLSDGAAEVVIAVDRESFDRSQLRMDLDAVGIGEENRVIIAEGEPGRGPSHYRNVGVGEASSDVVLFLDYDCRARPGIVTAHRRRHWETDDEVGAVAGVTRLTTPNPSLFQEAILACEYTDSYSRPTETDEVGWAPAANLSIRRSLFQQIEFDEWFPRRGGGEDIDLCWRLREAGYTIATAPDGVVFHDVWESATGVLRRLARWGRAEALLIIKHPDRRRQAPNRLSRRIERVFSTHPTHLALIVTILSVAYFVGVRLEKQRRGRSDLVGVQVCFDD